MFTHFALMSFRAIQICFVCMYVRICTVSVRGTYVRYAICIGVYLQYVRMCKYMCVIPLTDITQGHCTSVITVCKKETFSSPYYIAP